MRCHARLCTLYRSVTQNAYLLLFSFYRVLVLVLVIHTVTIISSRVFFLVSDFQFSHSIDVWVCECALYIYLCYLLCSTFQFTNWQTMRPMINWCFCVFDWKYIRAYQFCFSLCLFRLFRFLFVVCHIDILLRVLLFPIYLYFSCLHYFLDVHVYLCKKDTRIYICLYPSVYDDIFLILSIFFSPTDSNQGEPQNLCPLFICNKSIKIIRQAWGPTKTAAPKASAPAAQ